MVFIKLITKQWISEPDQNGNGFLEAEFSGCVFEAPVPVETHHVALSDVRIGTEQEFSLILEAAADVKVYADDDDYCKHSNSSMDPESFIPSGLFSPTSDPEFKQTPTVIIGGRVTKTYDDPESLGFGEDDQLVSFTCDGTEFDAVVPKSIAEIGEIAVGNIIHGVFWVQGWPD